MQVKEITFQNNAISQIIGHYEKNPLARVMLVQPTGTGKTIVARKLIIDQRLIDLLLKDKARNYLRIVYKCHIERLLTQAERRFDKTLVGKATMDEWRDSEYVNKKPVEVCYQMYSEKLEEDDDIDLVIYDECQHEACLTIQEFLGNAGKFPSLGMTATPERSDNCLLKFDVVVEPISRNEAVDMGYICETDINTIVDTSSKDKTGLLKEILLNFHQEMKQTMIFVRTKKEIREVVDFINKNIGEDAARGCGIDKDEDIDDLLDTFGEGDYKFLVSCRKLGEGIDVPGVTDVIFARNIGSLIDLNQYIGRAARPDVYECRVWEFVNCLSDGNLDTTEVVGIPKSHRLINKVNGEFLVRDFV